MERRLTLVQGTARMAAHHWERMQLVALTQIVNASGLPHHLLKYLDLNGTLGFAAKNRENRAFFTFLRGQYWPKYMHFGKPQELPGRSHRGGPAPGLHSKTGTRQCRRIPSEEKSE